MQHPRHRRRAGGQGRSPDHHVADPLATPVGIGLLEHEDRPLGEFRQAASLGAAAGPVHQTARALLLEPLLPVVERVLRYAHQGGEIGPGQPAAQPGIQDEQSLLGREGLTRCGRLRLYQAATAPLAGQVRCPQRLLERLFGRQLAIRDLIGRAFRVRHVLSFRGSGWRNGYGIGRRGKGPGRLLSGGRGGRAADAGNSARATPSLRCQRLFLL